MRPDLGVLRDLRLAVQSLRRSPGFTLIAVVTLALGIGANTSAFSILNALLLRPLPYPDSAQLDRLFRATPQNPRGNFSPADYLDLASGATGYGEVAAYGVAEVSLAEPGRPAEVAPGVRASANLLSVLGVEPRLGRTFRPDEAVPGNERVLVISDRLWQTRFGGAADVVGRTVRVDGEPHQIVGVLPAAFNDWRHLGPFDVFRPLAFREAEARDRSSASLRLVGRRSGALTRAQAEGMIDDFGRRLAAEHPEVDAGSYWRARPITDSVIPENARGVLGMLIGLSGFVLLIACSNLANLLLARTVARARELAVRSALGASRPRLLRPLCAESLALALAGGAGAVWVAARSNEWLNAFNVRNGGDTLVFAVDERVLLWGFGASLFTALAFGVVPALFALRLDANVVLKAGSRGVAGDRGHRRFRDALVVGQFALAMVLLAGAGLFARGLQHLNDRGHGWEADQLVTGTVTLPAARYPGREEVGEFQRLALQKLEALPGVARASASDTVPYFGLTETRKFVVAGQATPERGHEPVAAINGVSPRYFETVGTRVLAGRRFDERDTLDSPGVVIVNQAMARSLFGAESPLGRHIAQADGDAVRWMEVVGVVADVESVFVDRLAVAYQVYHPIAQEPRPSTVLAVRARGGAPATLADGIRASIAALDPDLPVRQLQPARATLARANQYPLVIGSLLSFLAVLGLGLACLGIYGVLSRAVAQRTGEFGIRIALGARAEDILRLVLASGSRLALVGASIGLLGALGVSRLIAAGWPGLRTSSVPVLAVVALLLVAIGLVAGYVPARHASRISPTEALRAE